VGGAQGAASAPCGITNAQRFFPPFFFPPFFAIRNLPPLLFGNRANRSARNRGAAAAWHVSPRVTERWVASLIARYKKRGGAC
jgi:hypothetical protein